MIQALSNVNKFTQRKRVFDSTNQDYLSFPNGELSLLNGESLEVNVNLPQVGATTILFSSLDALTYLFVNPNGQCILVTPTGNTNTANNSCIVGDNNIIVSRSLSGEMQIEANGVLSGSPVIDTMIVGYYSRRASIYYNSSLLNFTIKNESFTCNEGNGSNIVGSNSTIATVNTSHSGGLNYINHEVIKPI